MSVCVKEWSLVFVCSPLCLYWRENRRAGGHQPSCVCIYSSSCRDLTSGRRCCDCLNVPNNLNSITVWHTHAHARTDMFTPYKFIIAHWFVSSGILKNCRRLCSVADLLKGSQWRLCCSAFTEKGVNKPEGSGSGAPLEEAEMRLPFGWG